jgi:hypothetical protein
LIFPIGLPGNTFIQYLHKPTDIAQTGSPLFRKVMNNLKLSITQGFVIEILSNQLFAFEQDAPAV